MPTSWIYLITLACALLCADSKPTRSSTPVDGPPPDLSLDYRLSYFLATGEVWRPGMTTLVTLLMANQPLTMQIQLTDTASNKIGTARFHLLYKCSPDDSNFGEINLKSNAGEAAAAAPSVDNVTAVFCKHHQPFVISSSPAAERSYNLMLLPANGSIRFENSTRHYLEFSLLVRYSTTSLLQSKSLFVFNWDSALDLDTVKKNITYNSLTVHYTRYILTKEAILYLTEISGARKTALESVPFLDPTFLKLVASSSWLVKSNLAVTVVVKFGNRRSCSGDFDSISDVVISTGEPFFFNRSFESFSDVYSNLDLATGVLYVSNIGLLKPNTTLYPRLATVCLRISVNSDVWSYHATRTVMAVVQEVPASVNWLPVAGEADCSVIDGKTSETITLLAGMRNVVLRSPIVCKTPGGKLFSQRVYLNTTSCVNPILRGTYFECGRYHASLSFGVIIITGEVNASHTNRYAFDYGPNIKFEYNVSVVTLPLFTTKAGRYETVTVSSMHLWLFNLTCQVHHSVIGNQHVSMAPFFRVTHNKELREMSADDFALDRLKKSPRDVGKTFAMDSNSSSMTVTASYAQPNLPASKFIVICRASISTADTADLLGVRSEYQSETHTIVTYLGYDFLRLQSARISTVCYWLVSGSIAFLLTTHY